ncbi:MAG: alpha/beta hydrolase [Clostridiales bacterium]|nr:alpha/beta hydrolase [Clostridiales bacterium]
MKNELLQQRYDEFLKICPPEAISTSQGVFTCFSMGHGNEALLLLPGGSGEGVAYFLYLTELRSFGRIITVNFPDIDSISGYVLGIEELLEKLGLSEVYLMGHSFGGLVAQALIRHKPEMFPKVILSHTTTVHQDIPENLLKETLASLKKGYRLIFCLPNFVIKRINAKKLRRITENIRDEEERTFWEVFFREKFAQKTKTESLCMLKAMIDFAENYRYSSDDLKDWNGTMLIIDSKADGAFPEMAKKCVHDLYPMAEKITFDDHSHLALLSERDAYMRIYKRFFFAE